MPETNIIPGENIYGLYGTFYKETLFDGFLLGNHGDHEGGNLNFMGPNSFHDDLTNLPFHSARWLGRIIIPEDATYLFETSDNSRVCIQIEEYNDKKTKHNVLAEYDPLTKRGKSSVSLKKGLYKILIEYIPLDPVFDNLNVLTLYWESAKKVGGTLTHPIKRQVIPKESFLFPDFSDESVFPAHPRQTLFQKFLIPQISPLSPQGVSFITSNDDMLLSEVSPAISPLSEVVLQRLQEKRKETIATHDAINKQFAWWEESRQSRLPSRNTLSQQEQEQEHKDIINKVSVEKRTFQTWEAMFWDEGAPKRLDPDYDLDNPSARYADTDGDGLSNYDATNGFTIIGSSHRPWLPEYDPTHPGYNNAYKGYPKYVCSYRKASTAGDPYTDLQKAMGNVSNLLPITRNPLIAAVPCVNAQLEGYSISTIEDITFSEEKGFHFTTSNRLTVSNSQEHSTSEENSKEIHANVGISPEGPSLSGGGSLGWSHGLSEGKSNTNSVESSSDSTTDQMQTVQKHWNTGDRAYFNAFVRYVNTGTASMLKARPSLNFGVYNKHLGKVEPVSTVTPPKETAGEVLDLEGDSFYPSQELMPLVIQTKDTFNSQRITLNQEQWESVVSGYPMRLEVPQVEGMFQGKINSTKDPLVPNVNTDYDWELFVPNIENHTARITLVLPDGKIYDRRIAAPKVSTNKLENELGNGVINRLDLYANLDKVPVLTIGKAIQLAFDTQPNSFIFKNKAGIEYDLNRANINLILDEPTNELLKTQYTEKLKTNGKIGNYYDLDLHQGMRMVIEVPPSVSVRLTENKIPDEEKIPRQIMLKNNYIDKTIHYTIVINPPEIFVEKLNQEKMKSLSKKGVLKPNEASSIGLEYVSDQDIIKVLIAPDEKTQPKLLFIQSVAKLPGFVAQKERVNIDLVKSAYQFPPRPWVGDATQKSKCKGIEFDVFPKEQWDHIASFELKVNPIDKSRATQTFGPLLKTQLDKNKQETDKGGRKEYKVYLDFSLFNTWNDNTIQLGDTITITGKLNEVKKREGWGKVTACKQGEPCDFNQVYIPYTEPRTCTLYQEQFPSRLSREEYLKAFQDVRRNMVNRVASSVNPEKIPRFDNVLKNVIFRSVDPIIAVAIKEYKMVVTGQESDKEFVTLAGHAFESGNLKLSFKTETKIKVKEDVDTGLAPLDWFVNKTAPVTEAVTGADISHSTYNAAIPGLLSGRHLTITASIDEYALSKEDFAQYGNSIVIYDSVI